MPPTTPPGSFNEARALSAGSLALGLLGAMASKGASMRPAH